jgi:hypothetical protein
MKHVAVVPVAGLDASTRRALHYAGTLAPRVVALHVADGTASGLVDAWTEDVPLLVLDGAPRAAVLLQAIAVLKHTERAERVSVVLPSATPGGDLARLLGPGVVLCPVPTTVTGL